MLRWLAALLLAAGAGALRLPVVRAPGLAQRLAASFLAPAILSLCLAASPDAALAVSGGGKDFSGQNLEGSDFSGQKLAGKDFRGIMGANVNFRGANLGGTSFFKSDLAKADFSGADLTRASLEEAGLEGVNFENAVLQSAYLTRTVADAASIAGADFSEAVMPTSTQKALCARDDATGENPTTGVATRDSLMCP